MSAVNVRSSVPAAAAFTTAFRSMSPSLDVKMRVIAPPLTVTVSFKVMSPAAVRSAAEFSVPSTVIEAAAVVPPTAASWSTAPVREIAPGTLTVASTVIAFADTVRPVNCVTVSPAPSTPRVTVVFVV